MGPYLTTISEDDSNIVKKESNYEVFVIFDGLDEDDINMTAGMSIVSNKDQEEWDFKGNFSIDDVYALGKLAGMKPLFNKGSKGLSAYFRAEDLKGKKLYLASEKHFKRRKKVS